MSHRLAICDMGAATSAGRCPEASRAPSQHTWETRPAPMTFLDKKVAAGSRITLSLWSPSCLPKPPGMGIGGGGWDPKGTFLEDEERDGALLGVISLFYYYYSSNYFYYSLRPPASHILISSARPLHRPRRIAHRWEISHRSHHITSPRRRGTTSKIPLGTFSRKTDRAIRPLPNLSFTLIFPPKVTEVICRVLIPFTASKHQTKPPPPFSSSSPPHRGRFPYLTVTYVNPKPPQSQAQKQKTNPKALQYPPSLFRSSLPSSRYSQSIPLSIRLDLLTLLLYRLAHVPARPRPWHGGSAGETQLVPLRAGG